MVRTRFFKSQPLSKKYFASASSSSGFVGGLVSRMSSSASTMPRLKKCFQYRFTSDRAKKGLSLLVSQSANACRAAGEDHFFTRFRAIFAVHLTEESGEAVV